MNRRNRSGNSIHVSAAPSKQGMSSSWSALNWLPSAGAVRGCPPRVRTNPNLSLQLLSPPKRHRETPQRDCDSVLRLCRLSVTSLLQAIPAPSQSLIHSDLAVRPWP